jgi:hypothetical protein
MADGIVATSSNATSAHVVCSAMDHLPQLQPLVPIENRSANQQAEHGNTNSQQAADVMHSVPG